MISGCIDAELALHSLWMKLTFIHRGNYLQPYPVCLGLVFHRAYAGARQQNGWLKRFAAQPAHLFTYAEAGKDASQQIISTKGPRNFAQLLLRHA